VVEIGDRAGDTRIVRLLADPWSRGELPLPPYIHSRLADPERYQTVYAANPGSVAAPTAGLHLTTEVLERCRAKGVGVATIELAVGVDTFRPISVDDPGDHPMHKEAYRIPDATWEACGTATRVIAVGTTTVRALESAARNGVLEGRTDLYIRDPFRFEVVDVLMTNFHLPRSTLLLLVEAFIGSRWRYLYGVALERGYRFLSFGDAMLVTRQ
jgi:S-adenosylmethionine:tRNA ribosyltransferase-isomerase